jgi:hypothetical protein
MRRTHLNSCLICFPNFTMNLSKLSTARVVLASLRNYVDNGEQRWDQFMRRAAAESIEKSGISDLPMGSGEKYDL